MDEYQNKRQEGEGNRNEITTRSGRATRGQCANITFVFICRPEPCSDIAFFFFFSPSPLLFPLVSFLLLLRREKSDATALVPNG